MALQFYSELDSIDAATMAVYIINANVTNFEVLLEKIQDEIDVNGYLYLFENICKQIKENANLLKAFLESVIPEERITSQKLKINDTTYSLCIDKIN